jgi:hypothetical protein
VTVLEPVESPRTVPVLSTSALIPVALNATLKLEMAAPCVSSADTVIACVLPATRFIDVGLTEIEPSVWVGGGGGGGFVVPSSPPPPHPSIADAMATQAQRATVMLPSGSVETDSTRHTPCCTPTPGW